MSKSSKPNKKKAGDNIHVPARESTMIHPPSDVPAVVPLGKLVIIDTGFSGDMARCTGWIIQNPMSPGGQTDSYLVIPYHLPSVSERYDDEEDFEGIDDDPNHAELEVPPHGTACYTPPFRIDQSQIIAVLDPPLP